jgi:hypothetical protein
MIGHRNATLNQVAIAVAFEGKADIAASRQKRRF